MSFIPPHIASQLKNVKNSTELEMISELCDRISARIHWPDDFRPDKQFGLYIFHLSMIISNIYLIFADKLGRKNICSDSELPNIKINLYYLDEPKKFRLGEKFPLVNGGYTKFTNPMEIVVFRCEEMEKVLVHELVHAFHLDTDNYKLSFPYTSCDESAVNINEAITEFIAVIIHSRTSGHPNFTHERIWSYIQAARVTKVLGFNSVREIFNSQKCLAEKTSLISYYIIKSALVHSYRFRVYRKIEKSTGGGILDNDDNSIIRIISFVLKFRDRKKSKHTFQSFIDTAIRDEKWIGEIDAYINHPKLFTNGESTARMSISDEFRPNDVGKKNFFSSAIFEI